MTKQLKDDIKTIFEVLAFFLIVVFVAPIFFDNVWISILYFFFSFCVAAYNGYFLKYRKDTLLIPTLNDNYSKMSTITFGILILVFSTIGLFVFQMKAYYCITAILIGIVVIVFGIFESPRGWIIINGNKMKLYGIKEDVDARQLREIILKNDKITLTNIYGEPKNSSNLNLNPLVATAIENFIKERLPANDILITNNVTVTL